MFAKKSCLILLAVLICNSIAINGFRSSNEQPGSGDSASAQLHGAPIPLQANSPAASSALLPSQPTPPSSASQHSQINEHIAMSIASEQTATTSQADGFIQAGAAPCCFKFEKDNSKPIYALAVDPDRHRNHHHHRDQHHNHHHHHEKSAQSSANAQLSSNSLQSQQSSHLASASQAQLSSNAQLGSQLAGSAHSQLGSQPLSSAQSQLASQLSGSAQSQLGSQLSSSQAALLASQSQSAQPALQNIPPQSQPSPPHQKAHSNDIVLSNENSITKLTLPPKNAAPAPTNAAPAAPAAPAPPTQH